MASKLLQTIPKIEPMIKETLNELKLSNVPEKISAFKGIATKK